MRNFFKSFQEMGRQFLRKAVNQLAKNSLLRELSRKALSATVVTLTVVIVGGGALWAIAAFTEPTVSPASSVQDFAKNIMGADNADNAFSSSSVVANQDGSLIERSEHIQRMVGAPISGTGLIGGTTNGQTYCNSIYAAGGAEYSTNTTTDTTVLSYTGSGVLLYAVTQYGINSNYDPTLTVEIDGVSLGSVSPSATGFVVAAVGDIVKDGNSYWDGSQVIYSDRNCSIVSNYIPFNSSLVVKLRTSVATYSVNAWVKYYRTK